MYLNIFLIKQHGLAELTGTDFLTGNRSIDFAESQLRFVAGRQLRVEFAMTSGSFLGSQSLNIPFATADIQLAEFTPLAYERDIADAPGEDNVQSNWNESDSSSDAFVLNKPTIPIVRTDEEIRDVSAAPLTAGTGAGGLQLIIDKDDAADTVTFNLSEVSPGTDEAFYHGLSSTDNPASIPLSSLTEATVTTGSGQQFTFSSGTATSGDFLILLVPADHDISALINTGSGLSELVSFVKTDNVRTISSDSYHSYVLGPLVGGFTASYRVTLA